MEVHYEGWRNRATWLAHITIQQSAVHQAAVLGMVAGKGGLSAAKAKAYITPHIDLNEEDPHLLQQVVWDEIVQEWHMIAKERSDLELSEQFAQDCDLLDLMDELEADGNVLRISRQLSRPDYKRLDDALRKLGGRWSRSLRGHVFSRNAAEVLADVIEAGTVKVYDALGFFPTPQALAELLIERADIQPGMYVLEPQFGTGSLARLAAEVVGKEHVQGFEIQPHLAREAITQGYPCICADFLSDAPKIQFDRIVMNPPFGGQADIDHLLHAWKFLKPGGKLSAIVSAGAIDRSTRKSQALRAWLEACDGQVYENPRDAFRESGTMAKTVMIVASKSADIASAPQPVAQRELEYL